MITKTKGAELWIALLQLERWVLLLLLLSECSSRVNEKISKINKINKISKINTQSQT